MPKKPLSDEDLIYEIRGGNSDYMDYLLEKYKPLVKSRAATKFLKGGDPDDLIQEGMIGLYKAVRDYDPANEKGASFFTFAQLPDTAVTFTRVPFFSFTLAEDLEAFL